jgi:hypothetical protein
LDITQLILDDHHEQRRLFAILEQIDAADVDALDAIWRRLATFLEVHALAEEDIFYPALLRLGDGTVTVASAEDETEDAIKDHNEIRDAIASANRLKVGSEPWYAAVAATNEANGDHMAEEEREGLTDLRTHADLITRHALGVRFAVFEAEHVSGVRAVDRDPKAYIADHSAPNSKLLRSAASREDCVDRVTAGPGNQ